MQRSVSRFPRRDGAREISVWDPLVRLTHWSLAMSILLNGLIIDDDSKIHHLVGYAALAIVGVRLVWAVIGTAPARFSAFPPSPKGALRHLRQILSGQHRVYLSHNPLGALMVYNIWGSVALIGLSGYMMTTLTYFGVEWVEELHEALFAWLTISVAVHIAGVAFDSWMTGVNLMRAMVTGYKGVPEDKAVE